MNTFPIQTAKTYLLGALALGILIFLPAWTLNYWQGWVFIVVTTASGTATSVYMALNDPALLARRMKAGPTAEKSTAQKIIITLTILGLFGIVVFSALDYSFGWSPVPPSVSLLGNVLVVLGYYIDFLVFKENSFGGVTVQTFEGQKVISTGLYAHVRHPMYLGVLVMTAGVPLALGSLWGLLILAFMTPVLIARILDEEKLLERALPGYREYEQKVHYRLVPHLW